LKAKGGNMVEEGEIRFLCGFRREQWKHKECWDILAVEEYMPQHQCAPKLGKDRINT